MITLPSDFFIKNIGHNISKILPDEFVNSVSERYIELFESITGESFQRADLTSVEERVEYNINEFLKQYFS